MKTLHCSDAGFNCEGVIKASTDEEVLMQAAKHAEEVHGVTVNPEMAEKLKQLIHEEELIA
jgi:predicted small metal-binding protein